MIATKDGVGADSLYLLFLSSKCLFISFLSVCYSPRLCFSSDLLVFVVSSFQLCTAYSAVFHFPHFLTPSYFTPALLSLLFSTLSLPLSHSTRWGEGALFLQDIYWKGRWTSLCMQGVRLAVNSWGWISRGWITLETPAAQALEMSGWELATVWGHNDLRDSGLLISPGKRESECLWWKEQGVAFDWKGESCFCAARREMTGGNGQMTKAKLTFVPILPSTTQPIGLK